MKYLFNNLSLSFLFFLFFINCIHALEFQNKTLNFSNQSFTWSQPVPLVNLNTEEDEFGPVWNKYENFLYYNSTKSGYSKFYTAKLKDSLNFENAALVPGDLNIPRNNQSYITFLSDDEAYISSFRQTETKSYLNIFRTFRKKNNWLKAFPLEGFSDNSFLAQATVSPDGKLLVFSSDKIFSEIRGLSDENSNTDLWMCQKNDNGQWGKPFIIKELSSPGNEITPYFASNDTLYYSSDGEHGPGGYDIFFSVYSDGSWQRPKQLEGINTEYDESDFTTLPGNRAIFASNRPGGKGKLDLYITYKMFPGKEPEIQTDAELSIFAQVLDIKVKKKYSEELTPVINFLPVESNFKSVKMLDKLAEESYLLIGQIMKEKKDAQLSLILSLPKGNDNDSGFVLINAQHKINILKNYFFEKCKIDFSRIIFQKKYHDDKSDNNVWIEFSSSVPELFEPHISNLMLSSTIEPPVLNLSANIRPVNILSSWKCELLSKSQFISPELLDTIASGTELPGEFNTGLNKYSIKLSDAEYLILKLTALTKKGDVLEKSLNLNIVKNDIFNKSQIEFNKRKYFQYYLFLPYLSENSIFECQKLFFSEIINNIIMPGNLIIQYFDDSPKNKNISSNIASFFKEKIRNPYLNISTELVQFNDQLYFSKENASYFYRILIEK